MCVYVNVLVNWDKEEAVPEQNFTAALHAVSGKYPTLLGFKRWMKDAANGELSSIAFSFSNLTQTD